MQMDGAVAIILIKLLYYCLLGLGQGSAAPLKNIAVEKFGSSGAIAIGFERRTITSYEG